jgi:hypothetical protein
LHRRKPFFFRANPIAATTAGRHYRRAAMMKSAAIIIATTGAPEVRTAIASVLAQSHSSAKPYVVVDGAEFEADFRRSIEGLALSDSHVTILKENVGRNGFYGHRIYAAFSHLINADYVLYLDQDNWFDPEHVATLIETIEKKGVDWSYSLRKVCGTDGAFMLNDDCESLGKWAGWKNTRLVDTNTYCLKHPVAVQVASCWHGGWGQDRVLFSALSQYFPKFECTGRYSVNYRLAGNPGSVTKEFFEQGNALMRQRHPRGFPWQTTSSR